MTKDECRAMLKDIIDNNAEYEGMCCLDTVICNNCHTLCSPGYSFRKGSWVPYNLGDEIKTDWQYRKKQPKAWLEEKSDNSFFAKEYCKLREEYDRMSSAYDSALKEIQNYMDHYKWHSTDELPSKYGEDWVLVRVRNFDSAEVYKLPMIAENRGGTWWDDHDQIFGSDQLPFTVVEWRSIE